jgi:hypothetical protein
MFSTEHFGNNGARNWKRSKKNPRLQAAEDCWLKTLCRDFLKFLRLASSVLRELLLQCRCKLSGLCNG